MTPEERTAWLVRRQAGIGASDVAAAAHDVYGGAYAVVADKLGHDTDLGDNQAEKNRGHAWEQRIADAVQALTGMWVVGEQLEAAHRSIPHHKATLDGLLTSQADGLASIEDAEAVLEIKTAGAFVDAPWGKWITQVRWQMHVADVDRGLIVAARMDPGETLPTDIRLRWVERDHDLEAELVALADGMWAHVQAGTLPDPDCASALDYARKLTAIADTTKKPPAIDLDDIATQIERLGALKAATKQAQDEHDALQALVIARMGAERSGVTSSGWKVSYSANSNVLDALGEEAVLLAHPELGKTVLDKDRAKAVLGKQLDDYRSPIGARRITITPPKDHHS